MADLTQLERDVVEARIRLAMAIKAKDAYSVLNYGRRWTSERKAKDKEVSDEWYLAFIADTNAVEALLTARGES